MAADLWLFVGYTPMLWFALYDYKICIFIITVATAVAVMTTAVTHVIILQVIFV